MTKTASTIRLDSNLRKAANDELEKMGLNLTTYLTMAVKQLVIQKEVPFKIKAENSNDLPNEITKKAIIKAMAEEEGLIPDEGKEFNDAKEAMRSLFRNDER